MDTTAFLRRLGLRGHDGPSLEALTTLHAAFSDSVPYETVQYQFGQGGPLDPEAAAARIISREAGGYCFQLNGSFGALLTALGYQVTMHRGGAETATRPAKVDASHLVLTVDGLPDAPGTWLVDVGLGEGLIAPLPLGVGRFEQEPFKLRLRPSEIVDGWRLDHDPRSSLVGMDFEAAPATMQAFEAQHAYLSASPDSPFVRLLSAFRRKPRSTAILRGLTLTELSATDLSTTILESKPDFYTALNDIFGLPMTHLTPAQRTHLWHRATNQHEDFLARSQ
ncbi:arylamine N-acetyltransferase [Kribbella qitaiheensis]|uniref:Arylamine N-acetyltransferase n=1 Tax=Kribbella qitaiheensis TaxID=1544730 RepID=A0A7G6WYP7_9ACTN|nr:arylamine N-acetyltransferase [Kribbella qitaiheensis]QNE19112.1 arylamine N-acetyltransferase [Kribbella qitaiheensis]